ncbi:MAG TPA: isoprenyl transferase [Nitrospinota bacterium]|nr:isoprenyl transferase [Nitrospinota bacterium]HJN02792.1 isoprenyl transferase [Nitrospinota bacterium]
MALDKLLKQLNHKKLPSHIAIIMDGNGRWAKKRFLPRIAGHRAGAKTVDRIVTRCRKLGIKALTLYSFSDENWNRPKKEIDTLMSLLREYLQKELDTMLREDIRFNTIGHIEDLPLFAQEMVKDAEEKTRNKKGMVLTLALSYGSRREIIDAVKKIAEKVEKRIIKVDSINSDLFSRELYTNGLPEPDLLIRTSGELRVSNYLLYQIAYTELFFTKVLWPDFNETHLLKALIEFQNRVRRYGLTTEQIKKTNGTQ